MKKIITVLLLLQSAIAFTQNTYLITDRLDNCLVIQRLSASTLCKYIKMYPNFIPSVF